MIVRVLDGDTVLFEHHGPDGHHSGLCPSVADIPRCIEALSSAVSFLSYGSMEVINVEVGKPVPLPIDSTIIQRSS